jgi:hypothetical protein
VRKAGIPREWTEADQRKVDEQYNALYAGIKRVVAEGQEPSSAEAQALAGQAVALLEAFTMNDPEIEAGLANCGSITLNFRPTSARTSRR